MTFRLDYIKDEIRSSIVCKDKREMILQTSKVKRLIPKEIIWYIDERPYKMFYRSGRGYSLLEFKDCIERNKTLLKDCERAIIFRNQLHI